MIYAPKIKALIVASPAFEVKLYIPFAQGGIALWQKLAGQFFIQSYVKGKHLTHDPERVKSYHTDPLVALPIASNEMDQLVADAGFRKIEQRIDQWGIFTVSVAVRTEK